MIAASKFAHTWWEKIRPEMYEVIANVLNMTPQAVAMAKRAYATDRREILDHPGLWSRVALIDALKDYWVKLPMGPAGVFLGLLKAPEKHEMLLHIRVCEQHEFYRIARNRMRAAVSQKAKGWAESYAQLVDVQVRRFAQQQYASPAELLIDKRKFNKRYNGRKYEDDPKALKEPRGFVRPPQPYFSGTSSPQGW